MSAALRKLEVARQTLVKHTSLGGNLLFKEAPDVTATCAVSGSWVVYYDPKFVMTTKEPELVFVLAHELLHECLDHPRRLHDLAKDPNTDRELLCIAADAWINDALENSQYGTAPDGAVDCKKLGIEGCAWKSDVVEIYEKLKAIKKKSESKKEEGDKKSPSSQKGKEGDGDPSAYTKPKDGANQSSDSIYSDAYYEADPAKRKELMQRCAEKHIEELTSDKKLEEAWKRLLDKILSEEKHDSAVKDAMDAEMNGGYSPFGNAKLERSVLQRRKLNIRPVSKALRKFATLVSHSGKIDRQFAWCRDKRFGTFPGAKNVNVSGIVIGVDVSGSVSHEKVKRFYNRIEQLVKEFGTATVIEFNEKVVKCYPVRNKFRNISNTGGGTHPEVLFRHIADNKIPCNSLIVFTDGRFRSGSDKPRYDVLWCLEDNDNMQDWKFGKIVRLPVPVR
jgi:predicted metal-dependent peptidase